MHEAKRKDFDKILAGYQTAARHGLVARFESINSQQLFAPVIDLLPKEPSRVADIGAGTGRDAAWFAEQGHDVLAVEPVLELRAHTHPNIDWMEDRLPELPLAIERGRFGLVTLCGVWQHLDEDARRLSVANLAKMIVPNGLLIISVRHGPGAHDRRVFPADPIPPILTIGVAAAHGLILIRQAEAQSAQPWNREFGVFWTWLAFRKVSSGISGGDVTQN